MLLIQPILYNLLVTHLNWRNRRQYLSRKTSCFGFFVRHCYNRKTHYSTLEKPGAQNLIVYENQGKQRELSDYSLKMEEKNFFLKYQGMMQKRQND